MSRASIFSRQRGVVLVAVLLALAIMSLMVAAATALTRSSIASEGLEQRRLASRLALRSGLESARALIAATPEAGRALFDGTPLRLELGNGLTVEATIRDAAGLADLNRSDPALLEALFAQSLSSAEAQDLAARIASLRAKAQEQDKAQPANQQPANPQPGQPAAGAPAPPAPVVFHALAQLYALLPPEAATPETTARLEASLTLFNPTGRINPLAAPDSVLQAIPTLTQADRAAIRQARASRSPQPLQTLTDRLPQFLAIPQPPTTFTITLRLQTAPAIIPNTSAAATILSSPETSQTLDASGL